MNLEFFIKDKRITRKGFQPVVADTSGCYTFSLEFDREWDGLVKVVVFQNGPETAELIYTGRTWLPDNVSRRGDLYVACHGYKNQGDSVAVLRTLRMTNPVRIREAGRKAGGEPEQYTPTVFEQVMAAVGAAETAAQEARDVKEALLEARESGELDGKAATVTVGTVETGTAASVTNGGTPSAAVLNFVLPRGEAGPQGPQGIQGETGSSGVYMGTDTPPDGTKVWIDPSGEGSGESGKDGGYYTPSVTQPDANTMRVRFAASDSGMPSVDSTDITLPQGEPGPAGKSAYQYAVDGGYTGTEAEFAAKLAEALPNPNALIFTGAVEATYDGSEPVSVEIPSAVTDDHINELINTALGVIENGSY